MRQSNNCTIIYILKAKNCISVIINYGNLFIKLNNITIKSEINPTLLEIAQDPDLNLLNTFIESEK